MCHSILSCAETIRKSVSRQNGFGVAITKQFNTRRPARMIVIQANVADRLNDKGGVAGVLTTGVHRAPLYELPMRAMMLCRTVFQRLNLCSRNLPAPCRKPG